MLASKVFSTDRFEFTSQFAYAGSALGQQL
jgi:hypothetical protein